MDLERYNIRLPKQLSHHIQIMVDDEVGTYKNSSEFLCDLVRRHKEIWEQNEQRKLQYLRENLAAGLKADKSEFYPVDIDELIKKGKERKESKK